MNLDKLIEMQRELDNKIREEKGLQDADLVANTYVALQVELAEFANEARWFKHWSENQEPRIKDYKQIKCKWCNGSGDDGTGVCPDCRSSGDVYKDYNPLLEEYVDSLHFFLSLAIQKGWGDALFIYEEQLDPEEFDGELSEWYLEMIYFLNKSYMENPPKEQSDKWKKQTGFPEKQYYFRMAWILFLNIGMNGFDFTEEQIEQSYLDKNKINHERQVNGY